MDAEFYTPILSIFFLHSTTNAKLIHNPKKNNGDADLGRTSFSFPCM